MFLLVFALSEGGTYGWWKPLKEFSVVGPRRVARVALDLDHADRARGRRSRSWSCFYFVERAKERRDAHPLFPFAHLRIKTYRYGLLTGLVLAMGQFGLSFVLPVFLQGARHLTPQQNGWWQFPTGVFIIVGAQVGGRLIRAVGTTIVVRLGLVLVRARDRCSSCTRCRSTSPCGDSLPGLAFYGIGIGFAGAQLTNVVLSEVPAESSGVASGANTTVRQVGAALGVAMIGSLLERADPEPLGQPRSAPPRSRPRSRRRRSPACTRRARSTSRPRRRARTTRRSCSTRCAASVASGTRVALAVRGRGRRDRRAAVVPHPARRRTRRRGVVDELEPLEPLDVDPALLDDRPLRVRRGAPTVGGYWGFR